MNAWMPSTIPVVDAMRKRAPHQVLESQQPFPFPGLYQPLQDQVASLPTLSLFQSFLVQAEDNQEVLHLKTTV